MLSCRRSLSGLTLQHALVVPYAAGVVRLGAPACPTRRLFLDTVFALEPLYLWASRLSIRLVSRHPLPPSQWYVAVPDALAAERASFLSHALQREPMGCMNTDHIYP